MWSDEDLESVARCACCGQAGAREVFTRPDGLVCVECSICGLAFINPRPKASVIARLYSEEYYSSSGGHGIGYSGYSAKESIDALRYSARQRLALVGRHFPLKGRTVLEIGCATGEFSAAARGAGARVVGCDYSADAIEMAKSRYPEMTFIAGTAESPFLAAQAFDMIAAFEVIEHVLDPKQWMQNIGKMLTAGGLLVVTTPNYECGKTLGLDRWLGLNSSFEHLYFFSFDVLRRLAADSGMSFVAAYTTGSGEIMDAAPKRRLGRDLLSGIGILPALKRLRRWLGLEPKTMWREDLTGHNLAVFFRKIPDA